MPNVAFHQMFHEHQLWTPFGPMVFKSHVWIGQLRVAVPRSVWVSDPTSEEILALLAMSGQIRYCTTVASVMDAAGKMTWYMENFAGQVLEYRWGMVPKAVRTARQLFRQETAIQKMVEAAGKIGVDRYSGLMLFNPWGVWEAEQQRCVAGKFMATIPLCCDN